MALIQCFTSSFFGFNVFSTQYSLYCFVTLTSKFLLRYLVTLHTIIRVGLPILAKLVELVSSAIVFLCLTTLSLSYNNANYPPAWIPDCDTHEPTFLDFSCASDSSS